MNNVPTLSMNDLTNLPYVLILSCRRTAEQQTEPSNQIKAHRRMMQMCTCSAETCVRTDGESPPSHVIFPSERNNCNRFILFIKIVYLEAFFLSQKARRNYSLSPGVPIAASHTFN